jgi:hypothetical protein
MVAACDLDRTMIFSERALGIGGARETVPPLVCVEIHRGQRLSFMTETAFEDVRILAESGSLIPMTTRTVGQYRRVCLPGPTPRFAVCANGGRLLVDGVEDHAYTRRMAKSVRLSAPVAEVERRLGRLVTRGHTAAKVRVAQDLFCYLVFERGPERAEIAAVVATIADQLDWVVSPQGRKMYVMPRCLTKAAAVTEILDKWGSPTLLAAGDSLLDVGVLDASEAGMVPAGSFLEGSGWRRAHVRLTNRPGVLAGEEIMHWLSGRVLPRSRRTIA